MVVMQSSQSVCHIRSRFDAANEGCLVETISSTFNIQSTRPGFKALSESHKKCEMHGQAAIIHRPKANYAFASIPISEGELTKVQLTPYSKALYNLTDPYPESDLYPASEDLFSSRETAYRHLFLSTQTMIF